jgi:hypothetical protein
VVDREGLAMTAIKREEFIGGQRLLLGDCLEVMQELGPVDAVVTDAPFGISDAPLRVPQTGKRRGQNATWWKPSDWDKSLDPRFGGVCDLAPMVVWFGQWRKREEVAGFMRWPLRAEIVWAKDCHVGPPSPVAARDERIWVFAETGVKGATFETSVWDHPHKNEPATLMRRLIEWTGGTTHSQVACGRSLDARASASRLTPTISRSSCKRVEEAARQPDLFVEPAPKPEQTGMDL